MRSQRGGSFLEILIALLVFVGSSMGLLTQQWQISRAVHHMQADLKDLWDKDNQDESSSPLSLSTLGERARERGSHYYP